MILGKATVSIVSGCVTRNAGYAGVKEAGEFKHTHAHIITCPLPTNSDNNTYE